MKSQELGQSCISDKIKDIVFIVIILMHYLSFSQKKDRYDGSDDNNIIIESSYQKINVEHSPNIFTFILVDKSDTLTCVAFANIYYQKSKKHIGGGTQSDSEGNAQLYIEKMPMDSVIRIEALGYQPLKIPIFDLEGTAWKVFLQPCEVIIH
ncbi:MAG: hypothetical protein FWG84_07370 [Bacteroidales bacterium]|nr:hypothetical protein [Bacteroidales bacterium]